jgi:hypothetical protein
MLIDLFAVWPDGEAFMPAVHLLQGPAAIRWTTGCDNCRRTLGRQPSMDTTNEQPGRANTLARPKTNMAAGSPLASSVVEGKGEQYECGH